MAKSLPELSQRRARHLWLHAQKLTQAAPFGSGPQAVHRAISHLGYVQIDVINVIERCHHHILFNRIPTYTPQDLEAAQSHDKSVFEYWTHALAYLPIEAFPHMVKTMRNHAKSPTGWGGKVEPNQMRKVLKRIRDEGPLSVSDFKNDKLVDKNHLWASRKPSKQALEAGFYSGKLCIAQRKGVEKFYELTLRHFGLESLPNPATPAQTLNYELDRALKSQAIISLDSVCHLAPARKVDTLKLIEKRMRAKKLVELRIVGDDKTRYFAQLETLENSPETPSLTHILSPFDPMVIQRKRTEAIFDYFHIFEAYVPESKRKLGYFTLPVLIGDRFVAGLDLKTDRAQNQLLIQNWHWFDEARHQADKIAIEEALHKFVRFQLPNAADSKIKGEPFSELAR